MEEYFTYIEGNIPVLISAPHVYAHRRPSLRGVLKGGELYLDEIVREVTKPSGSYGIYLNNANPEYDPNYTKLANNPYKMKIKELIEGNKINTVIDLHGLSNKHNYDLGVYHCIRFQKSKRLALEFLDRLAKRKEFFGVNYHIGYMVKNLQETITEYTCEHLRVPSFQIEISYDIRNSKVLKGEFISALSEFITNL